MATTNTDPTSDIDSLIPERLDRAAVAAWSDALGDPDWLRQRRLEALEALGKHDKPQRKDEAWRFTNPTLAGLDRHTLLRAAGEAFVSADAAGVLAGESDLKPGGVATVVDGAAIEVSLEADLAAKGVILTDLLTAAREHAHLVEPRFMTTAAPFAESWHFALHAAAVSAGTFLYVPKGVEVEVPIGAIYRRTRGGATFAHTLIVVEDGAALTFVQHHSSPESLTDEAFHHGLTEVLIGRDANVEYLSLQEWESQAVNHFGTVRFENGPGARLRSYLVTLGGGAVRMSPETRMYRRSEADLLGAAFADTGQRFEHRTTTHHVEEMARSNLLFKGGLLGTARNILYGNVIIHPGARGTDAGQTMRNLVLSKTAHAEAIPFLEIENSDVKAAHAAATGRLDDLHLFYLESRGIPREVARRMVVFGFFEQIIAQVKVPAVRRRLEAALEAELAKEGGA